jgi:hypothetical protein
VSCCNRFTLAHHCECNSSQGCAHHARRPAWAASGRWFEEGAPAAPAMMAKPKYEQAIPFGYQFNPEIYLSDRPKHLISAVTARHGGPPCRRCRKQDNVKQGDVS